MVINTPAAYGTYSDDAAILEVVQALHQSGFDKQDICLMIPPTHPVAAVLNKSNIRSAGLEDGTAMIGWADETWCRDHPDSWLFHPVADVFSQSGDAKGLSGAM